MASVSGSSQVVGLTVNGMSIVVTGDPNQVLPLPLGLGTIVVNEQSSTVSGNTGEITVTALHVTVVNVAELFLAVSPTVNVLDQFGALDLHGIAGTCRKADTLCVPSLKTEL